MGRNRYSPPVAGDSVDSTLQEDRARADSLDASEFLKDARFLDNAGDGWDSSSGDILQIEHGLGRALKGWFLVSPFWILTGHTDVRQYAETDPDDSWYIDALASTHLQIFANSSVANEYNFKVVVF